ncbi:HD domain-containing protein [Streptomyces cyaneofuscatus]|uniref:HD domain-containing protein n=1 Tax=Streptomyces TaxID=1883 RepID=UPI0009CABB08|nr:hypothetical protein STIB_29740 [Streptomyces sp. IB2014 011-1]CAD5913031.1 HD Cas3-type domain-containing protein [Streptomyces sp. KY75]
MPTHHERSNEPSTFRTRPVAMLTAGLHDLGKATRFQACEPGAWALVSERFKRDAGSWRVMRHERASMHVGHHVLESWGYRLEGNDSPAVRIAQVLGGHHGRFLQLDVRGAAVWERVQHELGGPLWQETRLRYAWQVRRLTGAREVPSRVSVEAAVLLEGLVQLADRSVSQPHVWMPRALVPRGGALDRLDGSTQPFTRRSGRVGRTGRLRGGAGKCRAAAKAAHRDPRRGGQALQRAAPSRAPKSPPPLPVNRSRRPAEPTPTSPPPEQASPRGHGQAER